MEHQNTTERDFTEKLTRIFEDNGFGRYVTAQTAHLFYLLKNELLAFNAHTNLTAITDDDGILLKHFLDSVTAAPLLPMGAAVLDVGTGGGFPALPLAIVRPDLSVTAMDSTAKKLAFSEKMREVLGLSGIVTLCARAEEAAHGPMREQFDAVTARAVAALPVLAEWCVPFVRPGGIFIAMKSKGAEEEKAAAARAVKLLGGAFEGETQLSLRGLPAADGTREEQERVLLLIRKTGKTPREYPRENRKIKKSPL